MKSATICGGENDGSGGLQRVDAGQLLEAIRKIMSSKNSNM